MGTAWTAQIETLVATHRVYAVDLPGNYGRSEPTRRPRSFDDFARWYVEVLDAGGERRAEGVPRGVLGAGWRRPPLMSRCAK